MVKKVGKYELGRGLGEGTFGKVKYAIDTETNEAVAIKILDKEKIQKQNMGNQIKKEISIMKMVKHKYIVGMIEVLASKTKIFIVLELVSGGELFDKIVQAGKLSEEQARFYFQQLVEGVEYCHKLGVCHRDLKPENLLLDGHGNLKISDFGLSSLYIGDAEGTENRTELLHTTCGTPNYVAPEVLSDQGYDGKKADVWSIGVILYVLLAGFLPFDEATIVALFAKIQNADFTYPSWFSAEVKAILDQMLIADPKARITLTQIKMLPWFTGPTVNIDGKAGPAIDTASAMSAPTAEQMAAAVSHVESNQTASHMGETAIDEHYDDTFDDFPTHDATKPIQLNAFELVSQCGGFMLDRMFSPEIFYSVPHGGSSEAAAAGVGGTILFGQKVPSSKFFRFTSSSGMPIPTMTNEIKKGLVECGFDIESSSNIDTGLLRASLLTGKGMVGIFFHVFSVSPAVNLIEVRKGKGDLLEWSAAFSNLVENKIGKLFNKPLER